MVPFIFVIIITSAFLLSAFFIYLLFHLRENFKSLSSISNRQKLKYSIQPSMDIITKKLSISSRRRSSILNQNEINLSPIRSYSVANNLFVGKCANRRRSSIIDFKQIAQIEFSLPLTADKVRRRSEPTCNNLIELNQSTIDSIIKTMKLSNQVLPKLVSFSISYLKSSQIQIHFHSLTSLPSTIQLQQLTIKAKLIPDGKVKELCIKKILPNEKIFTENNFIHFSNISSTKLHEKTIVMKFYGKNQTKRAIHLGQIEKIHLNQIKTLDNENPIHFIHEIETIKLSSIEIFLAMDRNNDHNLIVDIQRIKGLKIDQKNLSATCFFQVILLDRHRPLSTHQTRFHRLNSSTFSLSEPIHLNILAFNPNNINRIMIMIKLYSNANHTNEHRCIARIKLASPHFCSGTGAIHWQQFKERQSFSMWHTLIKQ